MKHGVIYLSDYLGISNIPSSLIGTITRYREAIAENISKVGTSHFQQVRNRIIALREYYVHRSFYGRPMSWTIAEFRYFSADCDVFECQLLLDEIHISLKHNNIRYLESAKVLFEGYKKVLEAKIYELK